MISTKSIRAAHAGAFAASDFIEWLRDLHSREVEKDDAWLWSPAEFEDKAGINTGRGLANITAIWGVWLDNDGGELASDEFAAMFPHLMMVIHNSSSSAPDAPRWRAIIPTTCAMTIDVHREIMSQIRQALNRRGYYDKNQLRTRAAKGLAGKEPRLRSVEIYGDQHVLSSRTGCIGATCILLSGVRWWKTSANRSVSVDRQDHHQSPAGT